MLQSISSWLQSFQCKIIVMVLFSLFTINACGTIATQDAPSKQTTSHSTQAKNVDTIKNETKNETHIHQSQQLMNIVHVIAMSLLGGYMLCLTMDGIRRKYPLIGTWAKWSLPFVVLGVYFAQWLAFSFS